MERWYEIISTRLIRVGSDMTFPVSEMTYTVSSGTLNSTIPYHTNDTIPSDDI